MNAQKFIKNIQDIADGDIDIQLGSIGVISENDLAEILENKFSTGEYIDQRINNIVDITQGKYPGKTITLGDVVRHTMNWDHEAVIYWLSRDVKILVGAKELGGQFHVRVEIFISIK